MAPTAKDLATTRSYATYIFAQVQCYFNDVYKKGKKTFEVNFLYQGETHEENIHRT